MVVNRRPRRGSSFASAKDFTSSPCVCDSSLAFLYSSLSWVQLLSPAHDYTLHKQAAAAILPLLDAKDQTSVNPTRDSMQRTSTLVYLVPCHRRQKAFVNYGVAADLAIQPQLVVRTPSHSPPFSLFFLSPPCTGVLLPDHPRGEDDPQAR